MACDNMNEIKIKLRKEELELRKEKIHTGELKIHRETVHEEKTITVPVTREELVIEKIESIEEKGDNAKSGTQTIRIPINEEHIEVIKRPVTLTEISIYKNQIKDLRHIEEKLKSEKLRVKTTGDITVLDKN